MKKSQLFLLFIIANSTATSCGVKTPLVIDGKSVEEVLQQQKKQSETSQKSSN